MGSIPGQRTPGRYCDETLYENIKVLAKTIVNDMTYLSVLYSSTLEVGTGKSTLAQQIAEIYIEQMKQIHNIDIPFGTNNIVWRAKDLIERAFKVPRYSPIILDEWEDAHYWSELGMSLRQFFRKCRQLNLFIIVIIPNLFQLSPSYAISRSVFAIDVRFEGEFEKGYFAFYNFDKKRDLYIQGKKTYNYKVVPPNFQGRFLSGYAVDEVEYRKAKLDDMTKYDDDNRKPKPVLEKEIKAKICKKMMNNNPKFTKDDLALAFGVSKRTIDRWFEGDLSENLDPLEKGKDIAAQI
jgi:AraC-like DNA-binding protein